MAYSMVPRFIEFRNELPMSVSQKIEKTTLRAGAEANRSDLWDRERAGILVTR